MQEQDSTFAYSELKKMLKSYTAFSANSLEQMTSIAQFIPVEKGATILRLGQYPNNIYFVAKGILRSIYTDNKDTNYTKNLFLAGDLAASMTALLLRRPSQFTIEALEDSQLLTIDFQNFKALQEQHADLKNFYIHYLEQKWIIKGESNTIALATQTAHTRYLALLSKHPDIEQRIPLSYIASHLGITPTQLSRIRRSLKV